ncbi:N-6 DNA methylase [Aliarcobacter butzleri]|uniref:N-6 DNA methylase n=1 Tax=Aliarcobacter butzleri TaxID=28197 RepID=UPI00263C4F0E|nr:N-6 DNA methylase [Aliarcobacter butzleri]MDN5043890.1 N-6 DNA methylase [Aliarcobacter butzleri]
MDLKEWIIENIKDFNINIKTEEDLKLKAILKYLEVIGYTTDDMKFEESIEVIIGSKKTSVRSDIAISIDGKVQLIIDAKKPSITLKEKDILQSVSYAKLIDTPSALYAVTTNGIDTIVTNTITGQRSTKIPHKSELKRSIDKTSKKILSKIEIREIKSVLYTILEEKELYKVINECKEIIEKKGLIRTDQSFREMTKILLVKMNEERRVKIDSSKQNRFLYDYLSKSSLINNITFLDEFKDLFKEAKEEYPNIYTHEDEQINLVDNESISEVVKKIENFSFLGTGEDIKGTVYEIFLKSTLRGDFDQYFTPREIVNFIVKFADPKIGDTILDPSCGSGGFLIQAFRHVNQKIIDSPFSEVETKKKFKNLIDKCLWGHEADYDLHVLAKINLIMHGDGWNNVYQGDTLKSDKLLDNFYDIILSNPPFTIKYEFPEALSNYEMGLGRESEELDILFVEKCIKSLREGGDLYIVLPEGLVNNKQYQYFRDWLMSKVHLMLSISLPEGAFIPFGSSVSKTCILGLRKKFKDNEGLNKPKYIFLGNAKEIGFETGKKKYIPTELNDLDIFLKESQSIFENIRTTECGGEYGWILNENISTKRIDASYLLNKVDRIFLYKKFENLISLTEVCTIENINVPIFDNEIYDYLEVPDISNDTGLISNIRKLKGISFKSTGLHKFECGDILFTRINPRISRVAIVPNDKSILNGVTSKEVFIIKYKENPYMKEKNKYVLVQILQSEHVKNQIVRLSTGSSSSRARVQPDNFLNDVYISLPNESIQEEISKKTFDNASSFWKVSQKLLLDYESIQTSLGTKINKNFIRKI